MPEERLQKFLSECSVASRRKAEELMNAGKVKVNGKTASVGDKVDPSRDIVTVDGRRVSQVEHQYYILLNKPRGYVTTLSDELGRKCVAELVENVGAHVYPVGRLDRESEGLLLLTNDGSFANAVMHPKTHISKTYRVTVHSVVTREKLDAIRDGVLIDGRKTLPAEAHIIDQSEGRVVIEIVLFEGRNREIRKMCEELHMDVARLKRVSIGSLKLGMLPVGKWRALTEDEVHKLLLNAKN